jgi:hypothetical protein
VIFQRFQSNVTIPILAQKLTSTNLKSSQLDEYELDDPKFYEKNFDFSNDKKSLMFEQDKIFQNSQFRSLKLSEHGSLIQHEDNSNSNNHYNNFLGIYDDEELNLDYFQHNTIENQLSNNNKGSFIRSSKPKNINELKRIKLINKHNDYKIEESSLNDFYENIIKIENSLHEYDYKIPEFPKEFNLPILKEYLKRVNLINCNFDIDGNEKLIFFQMKALSNNICKFEGIADNEIMHELIKYFANYRMIRSCFEILDKFEKIGIVPNKDTLHLLIFNLKKISNFKSRNELLKLYLNFAYKRWQISTDITTRILISTILQSSKERLSMEKVLVNEGVDYKYLKWNICEDYINIELDKRPKMVFKKFQRFLIKKKIIQETVEDATTAFNIYIKTLAFKNRLGKAIYEISKNGKLSNFQNWYDLIAELIRKNDFWNVLAIINHVQKQRDEKSFIKIVLLVVQNRSKLYEFFIRHDFRSNYNNNNNNITNKELAQYMFNGVMELFEICCNREFKRVTRFSKGLDDSVIKRKIIEDLQMIHLWEAEPDYKHFAVLTNSPMNTNSMIKLWNVLQLSNENSELQSNIIDPLLFPYK